MLGEGKCWYWEGRVQMLRSVNVVGGEGWMLVFWAGPCTSLAEAISNNGPSSKHFLRNKNTRKFSLKKVVLWFLKRKKRVILAGLGTYLVTRILFSS